MSNKRPVNDLQIGDTILVKFYDPKAERFTRQLAVIINFSVDSMVLAVTDYHGELIDLYFGVNNPSYQILRKIYPKDKQ